MSKSNVIIINSNKNGKSSKNCYNEVLPIMIVKNAKYLGVTFDESLSFDCHIKNLIKRLSRSVGILAKVKPFLNTKALLNLYYAIFQRWSRGHKTRGQGQGHKKNPRPRPRTAIPRTDTLEAKDRNARGQGPRTQAKVLSKKKKVFTKTFLAISKKKVFTKIFQAISTKERFPKNFSSAPQNFHNSKNSAVLEPRTGQFSRTVGLEAKAKDFKMCHRGRPRGQGRPRGLHLCYFPLASATWFNYVELNF